MAALLPPIFRLISSNRRDLSPLKRQHYRATWDNNYAYWGIYSGICAALRGMSAEFPGPRSMIVAGCETGDPTKVVSNFCREVGQKNAMRLQIVRNYWQNQLIVYGFYGPHLGTINALIAKNRITSQPHTPAILAIFRLTIAR